MSNVGPTYHAERTAPALRHYEITPGAGDLSPRPRALFVSANGNATIEDADGNSVTYGTLTAGTLLPIEAARVTAASATLIAWY